MIRVAGTMHTKTAEFLRYNMTLSHTFSLYMIANVLVTMRCDILQMDLF